MKAAVCLICGELFERGLGCKQECKDRARFLRANLPASERPITPSKFVQGKP